ncbi:MAG: dTMP kinase [Mariprofundales bacterium]|nr:dTMP kinase [Mariprofundales bacterium]
MNHRFITFEGTDGCGKSTQLALTASALRSRGESVVTTREPGDSAIGIEIRRLLLSAEFHPTPSCELLLFLADRAQHVAELIAPALQRGSWVLCDRFTDSTAAYQLAARDLQRNWDIAPLLSFAEQQIAPARTVWLDLPIATALQRISSRAGSEDEGRMDSESQQFHQAVHQAFALLRQRHPERILQIDATGDEMSVQQRIQTALTPYFTTLYTR